MIKLAVSKTKIVAAASAVGIALFVSVALLQIGTSAQNIEQSAAPRAVIIDQLHSDIPNEYFQKKATELLKDGGYEVDLYTTENVTVDFYKKLPSMNYKFIVIRSHALSKETADKSVMLFSGEKYTTEKYIQEQLFGQVTRGTPLLEQEFRSRLNNSQHFSQTNDSNVLLSVTTPVEVINHTRSEYFLITPKFVNELMVGRFPNSTILIGGCNSLENLSIAKPLIERGASNIIGWNDFVGSSDNDRTILRVLEEILANKKDPKDAVDLVMENYYHNPKYPGTLKYYS